MIRISQTGNPTATITRLEMALQPDNLDKVAEKVAYRSLRDVVEHTPKRWFGSARKIGPPDGWQVLTPRAGVRELVNTNKILRWLDQGTRDHGPVTAKALFIPLTKRAVTATASFFGVGTATVSIPHETVDDAGNVSIGKRSEKRAALIVRRVKRDGTVYGEKLIYGVDYVLAKKVRGITAMNIIRDQQQRTSKMLLEETVQLIKDALNG